MKSILRALAEFNFFGKIRGVLSPYNISVGLLFLLCALYTGKGVVSLNSSWGHWRTVLGAFAPACLCFGILVYFLIPKSMNVPFKSLIYHKSQISFRKMAIVCALSAILALMVFFLYYSSDLPD